MNQLYIKNVTGGIFKIPFKLNTPYEVQARINGTIPNGKGTLIPVDVVAYIDMERLNQHKMRREIKVVEKKVRVPRLGIKPVKLDIKEVRKPKPTKVGKVLVTKEKVKEDV